MHFQHRYQINFWINKRLLSSLSMNNGQLYQVTLAWEYTRLPSIQGIKKKYTDNETHLGIKAFASSAVSGHKLAKQANSNL